MVLCAGWAARKRSSACLIEGIRDELRALAIVAPGVVTHDHCLQDFTRMRLSPGKLIGPGTDREKVAILIAMTVGEQMPLAEVKNRLSEVVERLEREHGRVVITKHGHPAAVVISVEDLESLEETLDVLDSEALLADIREALGELAAGEAPVLSKDQALRLIHGQ
jgi:prevent-host-death family protein